MDSQRLYTMKSTSNIGLKNTYSDHCVETTDLYFDSSLNFP